ncbi:MAG: GNAT family N-acetyltransferase [Succinivibrio sp.]|nr:GNAT family N-acetyltransferase [Succinivibrio sp.]
MKIVHRLSEQAERVKLVTYNLKRAHSGLRKELEEKDGDFTFKTGSSKYLKQIENLHIGLFREPLYPWLVWLYRFKAHELMSVIVDKDDNVIGYDLFFFQPSEKNEKVIHELYVGVKTEYQDRGFGVKLRQFSSKCYDDGYLDGISTLASLDNIKALRTAQKAGFAITKMSAKPVAHYLFKNLFRRY